jgi:hypothetical protein
MVILSHMKHKNGANIQYSPYVIHKSATYNTRYNLWQCFQTLFSREPITQKKTFIVSLGTENINNMHFTLSNSTFFTVNINRVTLK